MNIQLLDVSGRELGTFSTSGTKFILDATGIKEGVYFLRVSNAVNSEVEIVKLLKN
jgi:hypothetical protein